MNKDFLARLRGECPVRRKYLVGVSGGRDSMALLDCLLSAGFSKLVVCHLDHGLRGRASAGDARFVEKMSHDLGLKYMGSKKPVRSIAKNEGMSLETAARHARRTFFAEVSVAERCSRIFLAHHAEDQAESVLMNLARGCGIGGLVGMDRESQQVIDGRKLTLLRPLLDVRRAKIDEWIAVRGLKYREDASNADPAIGVRNAVRHRLMPMMDEVLGRDVTASLVRLAAIAREEEALISSSFADVLAMAAAETLPVKKLAGLAAALRRRVILDWLRQRDVGDCGVAEVRRVEELLEMPLGEGPAKINLPGGCFVRRREGVVFLERGA
jgi:tRNA(Ile)-lysidine synthase